MQRIGHYELIAPIGEGGMGVVYRALDTQLGRHVAIKVVREQLTPDPEARARFEREARMVAALNHPNICTIHGILNLEDADAPGGTARAIVLEFIEGQTLAARLAQRGPLAAPSLLSIAVQIADGLAAAHGQHIVHRDLKPQNILITPDERAKILDFGLARASATAPIDAEAETADTLDVSRATGLGGAVRGTVPYLSPEQLAGKPLDGRSDVFAFGSILYEMAAGRRPFRGDTTLELMSQILQSAPPPLDARADLPTGFERVVRRCLEKRPEDRYQDTRDLVADLRSLGDALRAGTSSVIQEAPSAATKVNFAPSRSRRAIVVISLGVAAIVAIAVAMTSLWKTAQPVLPPAHRQVTFVGDASFPTISPDGAFVAFVRGEPWGESTLTAGLRSSQRVVVQDLTGSGREIEIAQCRPCYSLAWSPDGRSILVSSERNLSLVPRLGGAERRFNGGGHVAWNHDGGAFASSAFGTKQIAITRLDGGEPQSISLTWPHVWVNGLDWSPVRDELVVLTEDANRTHAVWIVSVDGTRQERVLEDTRAISSVRWASNGRALYYVRGGDVTELTAIRLSPEGTAVGAPVSLTNGLSMGPNITIARDGRTVLYTRELRSANLWAASLSDERAAPRQLTTGSFIDQFPSVSPDGGRIAFVRRAGRSSNVFTMAVAGGASPEQLSFLATANGAPAWAPDGQALAVCASAKEGHTTWLLDLRTNQPRSFDQASCPSAGAETPVTWMPGREILHQAPGNRNYHWLDPATGARRPLLADESSGWLFAPIPSPDGSAVAAYWNRSGGTASEGKGIWLLSADGEPRSRILPDFAWPLGWSADSRTVFAFLPSTMTVVSVPRTGGQIRELRNLSTQRVGLAPALTPDRQTAVYSVHAINADVWTLENFDPEAVR